jgi:hypothetical protein
MGLRRLLGVLVVLGLVAPPAADASWLGPTDLAPISPDSPFFSARSGAEVAIDEHGNEVFVWTRYLGNRRRVQTRTRAASGTLGPIQTLSGSHWSASDPQVAVGPDGEVAFAWEACQDGCRIQVRARSAAGVFSPPRPVSPARFNAFVPQVEVGPDGDAIFTWSSEDGFGERVQARARSAGGGFGPVETLSKVSPYPFELFPHVDRDAAGNAVFAWVLPHYDETGEEPIGVVQTRTRSPNGLLGSVENLSAPQLRAAAVDVAVDPDGDAVFAWLCGTCRQGNRVMARARSAAGALGPVETISSPLDPRGYPSYPPEVRIDDDGDAVLVWSRFVSEGPPLPDPPPDPLPDPCCYRIEARSRSNSGGLSQVRRLSRAGVDAPYPHLGVDGDGDAVVSWAGDERAWARTRSAAGALGPVTTLSPPGRQVFDAPVAIEPSGAAAVTWVGFGAHDSLVQAAIGP